MSTEGGEQDLKLPELKPGDERYIGFDDEFNIYYVGKHKFKIKHIGAYTRRNVRKEVDKFDKIGKKLIELIEKNDDKDAAQRMQLTADKNIEQENLVFNLLPKYLLEEDGKPFNEKKWFGDDSGITFAAWWDVVQDFYTFLAVKGSREERRLSLTRSETSQTA